MPLSYFERQINWNGRRRPVHKPVHGERADWQTTAILRFATKSTWKQDAEAAEDGKTLCRYYDRAAGQAPLHLVNA